MLLMSAAGDWLVTTVTGQLSDHQMVDTVVFYVYGEKGVAGPIELGNGEKGKLFLPGKTDEFKVKLIRNQPHLDLKEKVLHIFNCHFMYLAFCICHPFLSPPCPTTSLSTMFHVHHLELIPSMFHQLRLTPSYRFSFFPLPR